MKNSVITFKADEEMTEALERIPNKSEFIRAAVANALQENCPLCGGTGRQEAWVLKVKPPEDREGKEPCTTCWWSGVEPCRKCDHTGYIACPSCKNSRRGSKPGWIVEEQTTSGRTSRHKKIVVTACSTCGGVGKVRCPACDGMGGQPCKRCKGEGYTQKKVK